MTPQKSCYKSAEDIRLGQVRSAECLRLWNDDTVFTEVNRENVMFIASSAISAVYSTIHLSSQ